MVDGAPQVEKAGASKDEAAAIKAKLEEPGRFLLIPSEEITDKNVHVNATNIRELILPDKSLDTTTSPEIIKALQHAFDAVHAQRVRTGVPMFAHLNHPNFKWAITAEELMRIDHEQFFEVYNGHPKVNNDGDELMWAPNGSGISSWLSD